MANKTNMTQQEFGVLARTLGGTAACIGLTRTQCALLAHAIAHSCARFSPGFYHGRFYETVDKVFMEVADVQG